MRITKEESIAVIIDIQERLFPHINQHETLERNVRILIEGLQILKVPVLVTEQYKKGLGGTIVPVAEKIDPFQPIEKISFSCCDDGKFLTEINRLNRKFVILAGIEAHVCILQTMLDLVENGFTPVLVEDCVSSRKINDKKTGVERMAKEGAIITTYESLLLELCRVAGSETFKSISQLIK